MRCSKVRLHPRRLNAMLVVQRPMTCQTLFEYFAFLLQFFSSVFCSSDISLINPKMSFSFTFWVSYQIRPRCKWSNSSFSLFKMFKIWSPPQWQVTSALLPQLQNSLVNKWKDWHHIPPTCHRWVVSRTVPHWRPRTEEKDDKEK